MNIINCASRTLKNGPSELLELNLLVEASFTISIIVLLYRALSKITQK